MSRSTQEPGSANRLWRGYARVVIWLRWLVVVGWIAVATASTTLAPGTPSRGGGLTGLLPADSPAIQAEERTFELFRLPVLARLAVVQHDPDGLSDETVAGSLRAAAELDARLLRDGLASLSAGEVAAALPLVNATTAVPTSTGEGDTIVTYLFGDPRTGLGAQVRAAEAYADLLGGQDAAVVGVTGLIPAQQAQGRIIADRLPLVEIATAGFVLLVVGLAFRSLLAPIVTVGTALLAYLVTIRVLGLVGQIIDISVPAELEPLILALLIGVVADYSIFYLFAARRRLRAGDRPVDAARGATADYSRVILAAGLTVAAGTASLVVAQLGLYQAFGPGLALTVLTGLVVSLTLTPALMGIFGRALFWPDRRPRRSDGGDAVAGAAGGQPAPGPVVRALTRRPVAALAALACLAGLLLAAAPVRDLRLDFSFTAGLPAGEPAQQAAEAAGRGFARGVVSPTVLLVEGAGVTDERTALTRLQNRLSDVAGVAGVLGPGELPVDEGRGLLLSESGRAARLLLVLDSDPLGAEAVGVVGDLQDRLPALLDEVGLDGADGTFVGNTAVAAELAERTREDFLRIGIAASLVSLLLLVILLRSLVAPLYLLACSLLAVAASLGLSTFVFQDLLDRPGLTFYVPFATAVLSLALGSDYNIFSVGRVWEEARHRPLRDALRAVTPRVNPAIRTAGIALAGSLALVALIPLWPFQEIAFTMGVGLLIDVFVVRSVFVPSLITLVGPVSAWPGRLARPS